MCPSGYRRTPRFPRLVTDGVISLARGAPSGYRRGNFWGRTLGIVFAEGLWSQRLVVAFRVFRGVDPKHALHPAQPSRVNV